MKVLAFNSICFIFTIMMILLFFYNFEFLILSVYSQTDNRGGGFGIQERERARIHASNNDSQIVNPNLSSIILIITIVVIIGVSSYALYKIFLIRRKSNQSKLK
jgi:hypothetical protein